MKKIFKLFLSILITFIMISGYFCVQQINAEEVNEEETTEEVPEENPEQEETTYVLSFELFRDDIEEVKPIETKSNIVKFYSIPMIYSDGRPLEIYTDDGYYFKGWSVTPDGSMMITDLVYPDLTRAIDLNEYNKLYAVWEKAPVTVTLHCDDDSLFDNIKLYGSVLDNGYYYVNFLKRNYYVEDNRMVYITGLYFDKNLTRPVVQKNDSNDNAFYSKGAIYVKENKDIWVKVLIIDHLPSVDDFSLRYIYDDDVMSYLWYGASKQYERRISSLDLLYKDALKVSENNELILTEVANPIDNNHRYEGEFTINVNKGYILTFGSRLTTISEIEVDDYKVFMEKNQKGYSVYTCAIPEKKDYVTVKIKANRSLVPAFITYYDAAKEKIGFFTKYYHEYDELKDYYDFMYPYLVKLTYHSEKDLFSDFEKKILIEASGISSKDSLYDEVLVNLKCNRPSTDINYYLDISTKTDSYTEYVNKLKSLGVGSKSKVLKVYDYSIYKTTKAYDEQTKKDIIIKDENLSIKEINPDTQFVEVYLRLPYGVSSNQINYVLEKNPKTGEITSYGKQDFIYYKNYIGIKANDICEYALVMNTNSKYRYEAYNKALSRHGCSDNLTIVIPSMIASLTCLLLVLRRKH